MVSRQYAYIAMPKTNECSTIPYVARVPCCLMKLQQALSLTRNGWQSLNGSLPFTFTAVFRNCVRTKRLLRNAGELPASILACLARSACTRRTIAASKNIRKLGEMPALELLETSSPVVALTQQTLENAVHNR